VQHLGQRAAELELEIVLELEPFPLSLLNNVETMARFLDDVDLANVKANLDISHLVLSGVPPEEIGRLRGRVGHVHLSDCDGKVHGDLPPGRGVVPFEPYLREIKNLGLAARAISIELEYSPDPARIVEWVEEAYRETDRLLQKLSLRG
jgi:sugar phosphate isomerase/epimerase